MKTEKCTACNTEIDLVEAAYHEGMCKECYWEYEDSKEW